MNRVLNPSGKLINLPFQRKAFHFPFNYILFGIKIEIFNDKFYFYQLNTVQCDQHLSVSF